MASPYAGRSGRSGGSSYAGRSKYGGSSYAGRGSAPPPAPTRSGDSGIGHFFKKLGVNLKDVAYHAPGGFVQINEALIHDMTHPPKHGQNSQLSDIAVGTGKQIKSDLEHPLRNPGYTLLDLLPVGNSAAKIVEAGRIAKAGGTVGEVARATVTRPVYPSRTLRRGGVEIKVGSSQSALGALSQRVGDKALHAASARKPGGVGDRLLTRKVGKAVAAEARVIQDSHKAGGAALIAMGKKLKPAEQKALQVVAEEAPLHGRITASSARVTGAKTPKLRSRHQAELDLLHQAKQHVTDTGGKPAFTGPNAAKLDKTLKVMRDVAGSREDLLKGLNQLTDESIQSRKTNAARVSLGATYEKVGARKGRVEQVREYPGRSKTVTREMSDAEAQQRLAGLDKTYEQLVNNLVPETSPYGGVISQREQLRRNFENSRAGKGKRVGAKRQRTVKQEEFRIAEDKLLATAERNRGHAAAEKVLALVEERDRLRHALNERSGFGEAATPPALPSVSETIPGKPRRVHLREVAAQKAGGKLVGAEQFTASPEAVRIPDVATRAGRSLGRPGGVGSAGSIGHLKALGSTTHGYTGALRENAVRREDTTALVGESAMESAKYAGLRHVHELVRKAATDHPQSASDIAVRLEGLKSSKRMPLEVRRFIDNPEEFFKNATPAEQASAFEGVRTRLFINTKHLDATAAAEFNKFNADGKIGWVPKGLLGDLAKPHMPYTGKAVKTVDAVNNASRFAILYLKPAYAIPNLLGNAALNVLQQGFSSIPNLKYAARLNARVGPELAARIDTLMGEGFARAISAHGQGLAAGVVDKAASFWSKGVDAPFRRSSFIYEARRAGYRTPQKLEQLLTDPAHLEQLVEVTQRANREIIDYANLTPTEREVIRRVVFFYPWVKGSTVYAGRFLREHPVKAAAVGQVGVVGKQNDLQTPSYLEGSFDVGGGLVNPMSASILQTPAQVGQALAGLAGGDVGQVGELSNFLSPASAAILAAVTRRDRQGYQYPSGSNAGSIAFDQLVKHVPQYTLGQRISDALNGKGQDRLYPPNIRDAILQYTVGGVAPRKYNKAKLLELAAAEKTRYVP